MKRLQVLSVVIHGLVLAAGWPLAWYIRKSLDGLIGVPINPLESYLIAWPAVVVLGLIVGGVFGLFAPPLDDETFGATRRLLKTLFMNTLVVAALGFAVKEFDFGRMVVVVYTLVLLILFSVSDFILRRYRIRLKEEGLLEIPVLIVGSGEHAMRALQRLEDAESGYNVLGFVSDAPDPGLPRTHLGSMAELPAVAQTLSVREIMIAIPTLETDEIMDILLQLEELPVTVHVVSTVFGVLASNEDVSFLGDNPVFTLQSAAGSRPLYDAGKRCMDFVLACIGCLCVLPLYPLILLAIKLDSRGPVVFYQDRVGRHGQNFRMYKFRTMRTESDPYAVAPKDSGDPRITRVGAFLRKTSLDELPQLWNVINGSMSLVGPRPEMPFIVETYEPWQRRRLDVLPGITGLWQIVGRKDLPLHENLEYDFYYIRNRSLLLDIAILLKTIPAAIFQKGAY